ncbi:MAG: GntR family transcriptional regulator [Gemmatimonadaceae bacterium]
MAGHRRAFIASTIRKRIERGLQTRALEPGDRLPSTREIGGELHVDPRVVLAAYRQLADEGMVVMHPRSGVFVAPAVELPGERRIPSAQLLTDVLVGGLVRGHSLLHYTDSLRVAAFGRKLRFAVIGGNEDQIMGLCRELRVDYGLETTAVLAERLSKRSAVPAEVRRAHVLLTTQGFADEVQNLADALGKPAIVATVRPNIINDEWGALLRNGRVYVIATDSRFFTIMQAYLGGNIDTGNLRMFVLGRDDVMTIPPNAPTYVTEAARQRLGKTRIPGRVIPPVRILAEDTVRAIVDIIVAANLEADAS